MIYFLLIVVLGDSVMIESYPNLAECEIRRQAVKIEHPGVNTKCLQMEAKQRV
jgi:hypothetical protein